MRHASMMLVVIATLGVGRSRGEEPAVADASAGRPRMTMLEPSDADPLAHVEKAARRQASSQRSRPRRAGAAPAAVPHGPLTRDVANAARDKAVGRGIHFLAATQSGDGGWNPQAHAPSDVANTSIAGLALLKRQPDKAGAALTQRVVRQAADFVVRRAGAAQLPDQWQPDVVDHTVRGDLGDGSDAALAALFLAAFAADRDDDSAEHRDAVGRLLQHFDKRLTDEPRAFQTRAEGLSRAVVAHAAVVAGRADVPVPAGLLGRLADGCRDDRQLYGRSARIGCLHAAALGAGGGPPDEALTLADALVQPVLADYHGRWPYGAGGEVFLSLLFLGAMLTDAGGPTADEWSRGVDTLLVQTQNGDGSWTGSSCINSRVFCTSSALLVMGGATRDGRVAAR